MLEFMHNLKKFLSIKLFNISNDFQRRIEDTKTNALYMYMCLFNHKCFQFFNLIMGFNSFINKCMYVARRHTKV